MEKAYALARYVARTKQDDDPAEYLLEGIDHLMKYIRMVRPEDAHPVIS